MKKHSRRQSKTALKLQRAARLATLEARRQNKKHGLKDLVVLKDGLYIVSANGIKKVVKKGNFSPLKAPSRSIKIAK
jgi:hypothetical protein